MLFYILVLASLKSNSRGSTMIELPDFVTRGEVARLIPVVAETRKEQRAVSAFLAVISAVPLFADKLFNPLGQNVSGSAKIDTFTEVVLRNGVSAENDRPDGLIQIKQRKKTWNALIEAKIGTAGLAKDQIERYLKVARNNSIDALITISNEFATRPLLHPSSINKQLTKRVDLFHLSWTHILTEAMLLHGSKEITDSEQFFLLRELIRFLSHESIGVNGYTSMPQSWSDAVTTFQAGGKLSRRNSDSDEIVFGWHQECRDLSLQMSQYLSRRITVWVPKSKKSRVDEWVENDIQTLCDKGVLEARLQIPDTASDMYINADLRSRTFRVSMEVKAPTDKQKSTSRINWLLRQLKDIDTSDIFVRVKWSSRAADTDILLASLVEDPKNDLIMGSKVLPRAFEVIMSKSSGGKFKGRKTFIVDLEMLCPDFYERVGQHLKAWRPNPPKPNKSLLNDEIKTNPEQDRSIGNDHSELLEVPSFLQRLPENSNKNSLDEHKINRTKRISRYTARL